MNILPIVMTDTVGEAKLKLRTLEELKYNGVVHVDVMDGGYIENKTISPKDLNSWKEKFGFEFHLMVDDPKRWVEECVEFGAERIIAQVEPMDDVLSWVKQVMPYDIEVGIGLDLVTNLSEVDDEVWGWLDRVLLMNVNAGFSGQEFDKRVLEKIDRLKALRKRWGYAFRIEVDGGINSQTAELVAKAGADAAVANTAFWEGIEDESWAVKDGRVVYKS